MAKRVSSSNKHVAGFQPESERHTPAERGKNAGYLKPKGAAEFLGVSASTLSKWRAKGIGPKFSKLGTKIVLYDVEDLYMFNNERKYNSTCEYR